VCIVGGGIWYNRGKDGGIVCGRFLIQCVKNKLGEDDAEEAGLQCP